MPVLLKQGNISRTKWPIAMRDLWSNMGVKMITLKWLMAGRIMVLTNGPFQYVRFLW
jgi:hypothetical protein